MQGQQTDEWLMGQVAAGNQELLEPLVRRYGSPLLTYLHRMIGDRHRGEELFQEVFLAVWLKRKSYQYPRAFKPWLFAIATNRCRADFRKVRPPQVMLDESEAVPVTAGASPTDAAISTETANLVEAAVAQLAPQQRAVVVMRIWNQLSYAEIAESVGRSEGTVRSHMHHGLAALRRFLEPRLNASD